MTLDPVTPVMWHRQTRGGWRPRSAALAPPATALRPRGGIARDTGASPEVEPPRGGYRARRARASRRARSDRFWRSALTALALAVAVLVLLAMRAGARPG